MYGISTVFKLVQLPEMLLSTYYRLEIKRIGQVTMHLLYTRFTYWTKDNEQ